MKVYTEIETFGPLMSMQAKMDKLFQSAQVKLYDINLNYDVLDRILFFNGEQILQNVLELDFSKNKTKEIIDYLYSNRWLLEKKQISFKKTINESCVCLFCKAEFDDFLTTRIICPQCGSVDRERFIYYFLLNYTSTFKKPTTLLHISPEENLRKVFYSSVNINYLPKEFERNEIDITKIKESDNTFDIIICSHVLEHIKNDEEAIKELYRVLKPNSFAILQVPIIPYPTRQFDAPDQNGHVRMYGLDYPTRLKKGGFDQIEIIKATSFESQKYGIGRFEENLYVAKKLMIWRNH